MNINDMSRFSYLKVDLIFESHMYNFEFLNFQLMLATEKKKY